MRRARGRRGPGGPDAISPPNVSPAAAQSAHLRTVYRRRSRRRYGPRGTDRAALCAVVYHCPNSTNGSPFTVGETLDFAAALGLVPPSPRSEPGVESHCRNLRRIKSRTTSAGLVGKLSVPIS